MNYKIINKADKKIPFGELKIGDFFIDHDDCLCMRYDCSQDDNHIEFDSGDMHSDHMTDNTVINPVNVEITIK